MLSTVRRADGRLINSIHTDWRLRPNPSGRRSVTLVSAAFCCVGRCYRPEMESWHPAVERGPSLVFKSDGLVDEASDGFLDLVTARLWNGSSQKILLISDEVISLLDAQTSRASHVWPLRDVTSAEVGAEGDVVCLTLASGLWWARRPSLVLPSHERASLLCQQLAKRCAQRWRLHADGGGQPRRPSIPSESEAAASAPEAAGGELSSAWREQISEELARERQASASVEELSRGRAASSGCCRVSGPRA